MINGIAKSVLFQALIKARKLAYRVLSFVDKRILKQTNLVSILAYHSISHADWRFSIDLNTMKRQIRYLKKNYQFITLSDVEKYIKGETKITKPSIVLTFDDGYKDILQIRNFLNKQNIKPTLFLLSDTKNANIEEIGRKMLYLSNHEIKGLIANGWEIGCHSSTHSNLSEISDSKLKDELITSKRTLEDKLGIEINYFAYPRGKYSKKVLKYAKEAKYSLGLTMDDGFIKENINPLTIPRIGIDKTHTFSEFKSAFSPSVIKARMLIKSTFIGKYL